MSYYQVLLAFLFSIGIWAFFGGVADRHEREDHPMLWSFFMALDVIMMISIVFVWKHMTG